MTTNALLLGRCKLANPSRRNLRNLRDLQCERSSGTASAPSPGTRRPLLSLRLVRTDRLADLPAVAELDARLGKKSHDDSDEQWPAKQVQVSKRVRPVASSRFR